MSTQDSEQLNSLGLDQDSSTDLPEENLQTVQNRKKKSANGISSRSKIRWLLVVYDLILYIIAVLLILGMHLSSETTLSYKAILIQMAIGFVCIFGMRFAFNVYRQIWRYGGMKAYLRLLLADICGGALYLIVEILLPINHIMFISLLAIVCLSLLGAIAIRIIYYFIYRVGTKQTSRGKIIRGVLRVFGGVKINPDKPSETSIEARKIDVAIIGAGRVGVNLAQELQSNLRAPYKPVCFVDVDKEKIGRTIYGIPVLSENDVTQDVFDDLNVQEVIFAFPEKNVEEQKQLYSFYKKAGYRIKVYDYPSLQTASVGKRTLREFDAEELLFRNEIEFNDKKTAAYYKDRKVLVTGGGGSIGSEMVRQIANMEPSEIIILDIYENGAYDLQQELRITYGDNLEVHVEITSIENEQGMDRVFKKYRPDVVIHAAAHKHVPLMENNVCEAIRNNVFGTWITVKMAEKYHTKKFIMVSTDKAVNPTNVMGATKRMCEMIVISSAHTMKKINFNCTRFGNVLDSAGSVIPLFKKQIANGGPVTITDKEIVRYFMTIPEASNLVLQAGAMAKNGELSVLDMGRPVKILELAENMISLSGYEPYKEIDIVETGLRPGEKLYEELLMKSETLSKTDNDRIFIEKDTPLTKAELEEKMEILRRAVDHGNEDQAREALHKVVPTYKTPEEVNQPA